MRHCSRFLIRCDSVAPALDWAPNLPNAGSRPWPQLEFLVFVEMPTPSQALRRAVFWAVCEAKQMFIFGGVPRTNYPTQNKGYLHSIHTQALCIIVPKTSNNLHQDTKMNVIHQARANWVEYRGVLSLNPRAAKDPDAELHCAQLGWFTLG